MIPHRVDLLTCHPPPVGTSLRAQVASDHSEARRERRSLPLMLLADRRLQGVDRRFGHTLAAPATEALGQTRDARVADIELLRHGEASFLRLYRCKETRHHRTILLR